MDFGVILINKMQNNYFSASSKLMLRPDVEEESSEVELSLDVVKEKREETGESDSTG